MTTVGIMSMQRIRNYGSSLQAYALRRMIERVEPGALVTYVDYTPGATLLEPAASPTGRGVTGRSLAKVRQYNETDARLVDRIRFFGHKSSYAKKYFPMIGLPSSPNHDLELDVQVIGSDEVFNCVQSNSRVGYSRDLFGHRSPARRVISYAGSFGNTTLSKIEFAGIRDQLAEDLAALDAVSVRDPNSARIVEALTGIHPTVNVDPVLAYEDLLEDPRIPQGRLFDSKYILVYGYPGRITPVESRAITAYSRRIGARVLCFGGVQPGCDRFIDCNPFELMAYFRDAEGVITDTFHGTIFSIINAVPFGTLVRPSLGQEYGNEEKLGFLLQKLGLVSHRLTDPADLGEVLSETIHTDSVTATLTQERAAALDYLSANIA